MLSHDDLIDQLAATTLPVKRVAPAWIRAAAAVPAMLALGWIATVLFHRAILPWSLPDASLGMANAALSLLLGAAFFLRALTVSIAGRKSGVTAWLIAGFAAWAVVTILSMGSPVGLSEAYEEGRYCFTFLLAAGLPMIAIAIGALRRTRSLTPRSSLATAGAAISFLSFGLLAFCHPAATTLADTAGHLAAALVLGALTTLIGSKAITA